MLNISSWKEFKIRDLFLIKNGKGLTIDEINNNPGTIPCIQGGESNNGSIGNISKDFCVSNKYIIVDEPCLTVARVGTAGCVNYWDGECAIGDKCKALILKKHKSQNTYLFLQTILNKLQYKFCYGRGLVTDTYLDEIIKLPVNKIGDPDFDYIESFMNKIKEKKDTHNSPLSSSVKTSKSNRIPIKNQTCWIEFELKDIFELKGGFFNKKPEHSDAENCDVPFLASTESNNGITEYYTLDDIYSWSKTGEPDATLDKKMFNGNCIAVTVNGSVCNAFYQRKNFTCSHDITVLYLKKQKLDVYLGMFLCSIIMKEKYRWSYGRKPHDVKKFSHQTIKLPVLCDSKGVPLRTSDYTYNSDGYVPDFDFMRSFVKKLPYSDKF